ncbi:MAG: flippase-like domain-containing protein [Synergistaceae bacterium]|nr:flippase-like domain-containing protein [Synergistaceae bacterium]
MLDFKRIFVLVLKYGISAACLFYVFMDVPLADLSAALRLYSIPPIAAVVCVSFAAYSVMGLRLSYMADPPMSFRSTLCGTLVGMAFNNVLPAKAGEIAKAMWIGRENGVSSQKTLGIVFMERFFDVNVLALLSLWLLWAMGERFVAVTFVTCLAVGWCVLAVFRGNPALTERFIGLFGKGRLGTFVSQALSGVLDNMSLNRLLWLLGTSLTSWSLYATQMFLCLNFVAGLGLSLGAALSVFAVSGLSMLLPSSPGAIGVYQAFVVTLLKRYGIEPDAALAIALVSHMIQFIPVTLVGGLIFAAFPVKSIKG